MFFSNTIFIPLDRTNEKCCLQKHQRNCEAHRFECNRGKKLQQFFGVEKRHRMVCAQFEDKEIFAEYEKRPDRRSRQSHR